MGEGKGHPFQYSGLENSMDCISLWTEEPGGYSPWGHKELDVPEQLSTAQQPLSD